MNSTQLFGRDHERVGVDGSHRMRRWACDEPDRYAGKDGRKKCREQDRPWPVHVVDRSEVFEMLQAGPAIFAINKLKNARHWNQLHC